jgi:hypothetical protein
MNRLLVFAASMSLAIVTISSTCLTQPGDIAGMESHSTAVSGDRGGPAFSMSATIGPSLMGNEGWLSL